MNGITIPEPPASLLDAIPDRFERDRIRIAWRMGWVQGRTQAAVDIRAAAGDREPGWLHLLAAARIAEVSL